MAERSTHGWTTQDGVRLHDLQQASETGHTRLHTHQNYYIEPADPNCDLQIHYEQGDATAASPSWLDATIPFDNATFQMNRSSLQGQSVSGFFAAW